MTETSHTTGSPFDKNTWSNVLEKAIDALIVHNSELKALLSIRPPRKAESVQITKSELFSGAWTVEAQLANGTAEYTVFHNDNPTDAEMRAEAYATITYDVIDEQN